MSKCVIKSYYLEYADMQYYRNDLWSSIQNAYLYVLKITV